MNIEQERADFEAWYQHHHGDRDVYALDESGEYADKQVQGAFNVWQARAALQSQPLTVDALAQEIRRVNGNNTLGAGALAEALMPFIQSVLQSQDREDAERLQSRIEVMRQLYPGSPSDAELDVAIDHARAAIEADRQRRGEPVAEVVLGDDGIYIEPIVGRPLLIGDKLYSAPQPAEPEPCFCDRMYPDSNPDASCGDCPTRDYKKPAEPVKSSLKVSYDAYGDCLYVVCDSNEPADTDEDDKGILYRRAISDGRLVGITIMNFMGRHAEIDEAPQPSEPDRKTDWNNETSSWSEEDFIHIFHERPDLANRLRKMLAETEKGVIYGPNGFIATTTNPDPVKVDAKASSAYNDVLADALTNLEHDDYEQSYSGYKNRQADVELIRASLAAMGSGNY